MCRLCALQQARTTAWAAPHRARKMHLRHFAAADKTLAAGSVDYLSNEIGASVRDVLRQRFVEVLERKKHADESVEEGCAYAAAYEAYTH